MEEGFHIIEQKAIEEKDIPTFKEISAFRWIQNVRNKNFGTYEDYTILGLDELLDKVENRDAFAKYLRDMLVENANYLVSTGATFQFIVETLEMWEAPVIKTRGGKVLKLPLIFGALVRKDVNWFYQELNVQS